MTCVVSILLGTRIRSIDESNIQLCVKSVRSRVKTGCAADGGRTGVQVGLAAQSFPEMAVGWTTANGQGRGHDRVRRLCRPQNTTSTSHPKSEPVVDSAARVLLLASWSKTHVAPFTVRAAATHQFARRHCITRVICAKQ